MFTINGIEWHIKFVHPHDENLYRDDGSIAIGMCDNNKLIIYLNKELEGYLLKKVLCHELVHAAMFSYEIYLSYEQEELVANIIATYGEEIIKITNTLFEKLREVA